MSDFDIIRSTLESIRQDVAEVRTGQITASTLASAAREAAAQAALGVREVGETVSHIRERVASMEATMKPLVTVPDRLKGVETEVAIRNTDKLARWGVVGTLGATLSHALYSFFHYTPPHV